MTDSPFDFHRAIPDKVPVAWRINNQVERWHIRRQRILTGTTEHQNQR